MRTRTDALVPAFACLLLLSLITPSIADNWPRFRGPGGSGVSEQAGIPVSWTAKDYAWKTKLPGLGHSSPAAWGDHVFITAASEDGTVRTLSNVDSVTGKIRWTKTVAGKTHVKHAWNSYASATPATDGKRVYSLFATDEEMLIVSYDFSGQEIWKRDLGPYFQQANQRHGCGTSPILFEDLVILSNQQDGKSFVIALDTADGKIRWQNDRQARTAAHSTPLVVRTSSGEPRLMYSSTGDGITALKPRSGDVLFRADLLRNRCVGSPVVAGNLVLATCGAGGKGRFLAAIPTNGSGDLKLNDAVWTKPATAKLPYVPTPLAYMGYLFLWCDDGVVVCLDVKSGKEQFRKRVPGRNFSGSPICVAGKLYCVSHQGTVVVLDAGPKFKLLGRSELGEESRATPAVAGGRMFLRGFEHLYCLKAK